MFGLRPQPSRRTQCREECGFRSLDVGKITRGSAGAAGGAAAAPAAAAAAGAAAAVGSSAAPPFGASGCGSTMDAENHLVSPASWGQDRAQGSKCSDTLRTRVCPLPSRARAWPATLREKEPIRRADETVRPRRLCHTFLHLLQLANSVHLAMTRRRRFVKKTPVVLLMTALS